MRNDPCFPCVEQPLRCFISSVYHNKQISCDSKGNISSSLDRKKLEEFYIIEHCNGVTKIRSVSHGKLLISAPDGCIKGCNEPSHDDYEEWYLHKDARNGYYTISSIENARYLACEKNGDISTIEEHREEDSSWKIELLTGELCFISLSEEDKRLTCGPKGKIEMSDNWKGWEVWRFIEAGEGDVRISSWTHNRVLCDDASGNVISTENLLGDWEKWKVERAPDGFEGVVIRSRSHGRYLRSDGEQINTSRLFEGSSTTWHLSAGHNQHYFISSITHDKRIGCSKKNIYSTTNRKNSETWELQKLENGLVVLQSTAHHTYLSFDGNTFEAVDSIDDNGMWKVEESEGKGMRIISKKHDQALSCDKDGNLSAVNKNFGASELWALEPCMPPTIRAQQMATIVTGGAIAVASIALMPFAVMGVVGALGFGSGGIAAGSVAAGMMSAEVAAGGIVAGGTVATLQSIGAAGLGVVGTSAAMGGGAIVGASALGVSVAVSGVHKKKFEEGAEIGNSQENRPFCNWKMW